LITRTILGEQYRSLSYSLCRFFPLPCYLVPFRLKYYLQHSILKHPQCEGPSFIPIQNNRKNYGSIYFNI
jgi:hypothetical protein